MEATTSSVQHSLNLPLDKAENSQNKDFDPNYFLDKQEQSLTTLKKIEKINEEIRN